MPNSMDLRGLLQIISQNYLDALTQPFKEHSLANIIRKKPKEIIPKIVNFGGMYIKGSPGQGQWTAFPWIAVINKNVTDGAQDGIYVVYLFAKSMDTIYLTLNQGVTKPIEKYGRRKGLNMLQNIAQNIRFNYEVEDFRSDNMIEIGNYGLGNAYEKGTIFYKKYYCDNLPRNEELENDLKKIVIFYNDYMYKTNILTSNTEFRGKYKNNVEEGKRILTTHYSYERDPKIVNDFKKKCIAEQRELRCEVCNFSFEETYGDRGHGFIEVHHLKPVSQMKPGEKTSLNDLALICSNCHKMIHRKMPYLTINELKQIMKK